MLYIRFIYWIKIFIEPFLFLTIFDDTCSLDGPRIDQMSCPSLQE